MERPEFSRIQLLFVIFAIIVLTYFLLAPFILKLSIPHMKNADNEKNCAIDYLEYSEAQVALNSKWKPIYNFLDLPASLINNLEPVFDDPIIKTEEPQPDVPKLEQGKCVKGELEPPEINKSG